VTAARQRLGAAGERLVARAYVEAGFTVLAKNWRCGKGEIDLIVASDTTIVFCEVKTRRGSAFGTGLDAVGPDKQRRLRRLAMQWLASSVEYRGFALRLDVAAVDVSVTPIDIVIIPHAC
jgi:putative endonuclease